ncbi:MAG: DegQ family serine endoprotease [Acidobacteria bacterium]|nr:DegQ family serine endoprotease [Acidobacteriota bacterium]
MSSKLDPRRWRSWTGYAVVLGALLIGGIMGSTAANHDAIPPLAPLKSESARTVPTAVPLASFNPIVKEVVPAVVSITAEKIERTSGRSIPFSFGPFGDLFGNQPDQEPQERRSQGLGSGVIVSPEGYILTNHHMIESARNIDIRLDDGRELKAKVVGTDEKTDIAVLKVEAKDLPVVRFGNSDSAQVGDIVLAVGSPLGLRQTVTMGIVGATGRGNLGIERYEDFIQTDAAINPGNSGGALINTRGELIGINTAILSRSGGNQGIGFAVPVNMAHRVMTQILQHGKVVRGYLGVGIQDLTPELARQFGASGSRGALVRSVEPGSPADKAGLRQGDLILEVDGHEVEDSRTLSLNVAGKDPGASVDLTVLRNQKKVQVPLTLGEFPDEQPVAESRDENSAPSALQGLSVGNLTPSIAEQLGLKPGSKGVVVSGVSAGSAADEAGLQRGDVIEEVARQPVTSVAEFQAAVRKAGGESVLLLVNRGGNPLFVVVEPRED